MPRPAPPCHALPRLFENIPCLALPCLAAPGHAAPCPAVPCRALPRLLKTSLALPCPARPRPATPRPAPPREGRGRAPRRHRSEIRRPRGIRHYGGVQRFDGDVKTLGTAAQPALRHQLPQPPLGAADVVAQTCGQTGAPHRPAAVCRQPQQTGQTSPPSLPRMGNVDLVRQNRISRCPPNYLDLPSLRLSLFEPRVGPRHGLQKATLVHAFTVQVPMNGALEG